MASQDILVGLILEGRLKDGSQAGVPCINISPRLTLYDLDAMLSALKGDFQVKARFLLKRRTEMPIWLHNPAKSVMLHA